jgi:hypothetical protein
MRTRYGRRVELALALVLGSVLLGVRAYAAGDDDVPPKVVGKPARLSGTSTIDIIRYDDGRVIPRTHRVAFFTHTLRGKKEQTLVLREQIDLEEQSGGYEGWVRHTVELTASKLLPNGKRQPRFTIHATGEEASAYFDFYVVSSYGCCDQADGHAWFSFSTGKLVMYTAGTRDTSMLEIGTADSHVDGPRYIGVHTSNAAFAEDQYPRPLAGRPQHAVVTYASETAAITRVLVTMPPENLEMDPVRKIEIRHASAPTGDAAVHIELSDAVSFELPIHADKLDPAHARLPSGVTATVFPWKPSPAPDESSKERRPLQ